jgi:hypothetical protein
MSEVQMRQVASQKSNASITATRYANVREGLSPSIARGAIYLADFWEEHFGHEEFEAQSVEDTQVVYWQGKRHVLGPSGYYVPDSSPARLYVEGKYKQGQEGVSTAYEGFLELPQAVVLLVLWVAGVALLGLCGLVVYWVGRVLTGLIAGSI